MPELLIAAAVALALLLALAYNALVRRRNAVDNAFAGIDAYLLMRYDLIPNLVETVKAYGRHESETLRALTELRAEALAGQAGSDARVRLDNRIGAALQGVIAVAEGYPELKASAQFAQLQRALNEVEERLSAARRAFNTAVTDYNNAVQQFPLNLVAGGFGFRSRALLAAPEATRAAPAAAVA